MEAPGNGHLVIANKKQAFWEISSVMRLLFSEINIFFDVEYCGKIQIKCGPALSVLVSTTILVIAVVKICFTDSRGAQHFAHCDNEYRCR